MPVATGSGQETPSEKCLSRAAVLLLLATALVPMSRPALAAPDYWDARLNQICGLFFEDKSATVPAGQGYWRLVRAEFENEQESGFNHHIYYKCLDLNGNSIENQKVWASWAYTNETGSTYQFTKGVFDQYWGNFAMYVGTCADIITCGPSSPGPWPYNAYVDTASSPRGYIGPSDKVYGMGMTNPQGTFCGAHVNFRLTWQWTISNPQPQMKCSPSGFTSSVGLGLEHPTNTFTIQNIGEGTLDYTISDNVSWLSVSPGSGAVTGTATDPISIIYSTAGLSLGTYNATITITSPEAINSPQAIAVSLTVRPVLYLGDFDKDGDVDQQDFGYMQACLAASGVQASAECEDARLDADVDVDQDDAELFRSCMDGSGAPGQSHCAR